MFARGHGLGLVIAWVVVIRPPPAAAQEPAAVPASAQARVLVAPVQGSEGLRAQLGPQVVGALRQALEERGYQETAPPGLLGQAVVACQTPECVEQALDAADAAFAIVPAIWSRGSGGEELTLTLVQRSGRSLNANRRVGDDLPADTAAMLDELLARQALSASASPRQDDTRHRPQGKERAHPHAWKAGPIVLTAGGAAAVLAVGVGAAVKSDDQQLNAPAVGAWSAIGAAAIAGGIAWWVVGEKKRHPEDATLSALAPTIGLRPTGIDLRLWF